MKTLRLFVIALIAVSATLMAQSPADSVKVHFDRPVMVGTTQMPAGECTITIYNGNNGNIALLVRSTTGAQVAVLAMANTEAQFDHNRQTSATLALKDGVYRLDKLWVAEKGVTYDVLD